MSAGGDRFGAFRSLAKVASCYFLLVIGPILLGLGVAEGQVSILSVDANVVRVGNHLQVVVELSKAQQFDINNAYVCGRADMVPIRPISAIAPPKQQLHDCVFIGAMTGDGRISERILDEDRGIGLVTVRVIGQDNLTKFTKTFDLSPRSENWWKTLWDAGLGTIVGGFVGFLTTIGAMTWTRRNEEERNALQQESVDHRTVMEHVRNAVSDLNSGASPRSMRDDLRISLSASSFSSYLPLLDVIDQKIVASRRPGTSGMDMVLLAAEVQAAADGFVSGSLRAGP